MFQKSKEKKFQSLTTKIKDFSNIYLFFHERPDPDALGSVFGLKKIIEDNFKLKKVLVIGEKYPSLSHLFPQPSSLKSITKKTSLAIICDTANRSRVDCNNSGKYLWQDCQESISIDHHPVMENFTTWRIINPSKVATCEIILDWAFQEKLQVSAIAAKYLYYGILGDSGRFLFPQTSANTLRKVAWLYDCGLNATLCHSKFYTRNIKHSKITSYILENFKKKSKVAYIYFDLKTQQKLNFSANNIKLHANDLSGFSEIDIWVLGFKEGDYIKISVRSKPQYAVNKIAAKFNGGGHKNSAGLKLKTKQQFNTFIKELASLIKK